MRCSVQSDPAIARAGDHLRLVVTVHHLAGLSPQSSTQRPFVLKDLFV